MAWAITVCFYIVSNSSVKIIDIYVCLPVLVILNRNCNLFITVVIVAFIKATVKQMKKYGSDLSVYKSDRKSEK